MRYELVIVGNDEAAIEMALAATAAGQRTLIVLPEQRHSSWIIGQALERLASDLLAVREQRRPSDLRNATPRIVQRLLARSVADASRELVGVLEHAGVDCATGESRLTGHRRLQITSGCELRQYHVQFENLVIATGVRHTAMHRPLGLLPFCRPESLLAGISIPRSLVVLGGESVGAGLAAVFSAIGTTTRLLAACANNSSAMELALAAGVQIGHRPVELGLNHDPTSWSRGESVVDCRQTVGFTDHLGLESIGVEPDEHGRLWCDSALETWTEGVFGIGDVVGFTLDAQKPIASSTGRVLNRIQHRIRPPHFLSARRESRIGHGRGGKHEYAH